VEPENSNQRLVSLADGKVSFRTRDNNRPGHRNQQPPELDKNGPRN
jgi:hypothetical protein